MRLRRPTRTVIRQRWAGVHWQLHQQTMGRTVTNLRITDGQGRIIIAIDQPRPNQIEFCERAIAALNDLATLLAEEEV